jgi:signal transduction histidine kinase
LLFIKSDSGETIELKQCYGMPLVSNAHYNLFEGVSGRVAGTGIPFLANGNRGNTGKYDLQILSFLREKHKDPSKAINSLMVVPIKAKGEILGVVKVINKLDYHAYYGEEDLKFLELVAGYIGISLENSKVYHLTNKRLAMAEKNAALSQLVRAVAHEINNTFGLIPASVEDVRAIVGDSNSRVKENLDLIDETARELVEFANDLAGFSSSRFGKVEDCDINELLRVALGEVLASLRDKPQYSEIDLKQSLTQSPLIASTYRNPLVQIFRNILLNAYQAMEGSRGTMTIRSREDARGGGIKIEFEDTGCGIKPEDLERIFDADFTTKVMGNGLGLWLTKLCLERIGGSVAVESRYGTGTTFTIRIPIHPTNDED